MFDGLRKERSKSKKNKDSRISLYEPEDPNLLNLDIGMLKKFSRLNISVPLNKLDIFYLIIVNDDN